MNTCLSLAVFCLIIGRVAAQEIIATIPFGDEIESATVDRPGDFYVLTQNGQIHKVDKDGNLIVLYSKDQLPTLFDPRDGARLFAFYREDQRYDHLKPSFEIVSSYRIDPAFAIEPWLVCPSGEHKLWLLDAADNSLKKLNAPHTEIEVEVVIDSSIVDNATAFTFLRDYQSFVFGLDPRRGILIFNTLGKHLRTIAAPGIRHFHFLGEELYYYRDGNLHLFDLFTGETRTLPVGQAADDVIITDDRMLLVRGRTVEIYAFDPH